MFVEFMKAKFFKLGLILIVLTGFYFSDQNNLQALAKSKTGKKSHVTASAHKTGSKSKTGIASGRKSKSTAIAKAVSIRHHYVTQYNGSSRHRIKVAKASVNSGRHKHSHEANLVSYHHHGRHLASHETTDSGRHHHKHHVIAKTRYAYPINFFMTYAPYFDTSPLPDSVQQAVADGFTNGQAGSYPARYLVRAGLVKYHPLRGGIFWRREKVKYIVMHSTETGVPQSAPRVIDSWSSLGIRHAGAQYVVDRDGIIYQACDPDLGTVHLNIFKTLPHINNDNCIGIEMVHAGHQTYTQPQVDSVAHLVSYLKSRYHVSNENIITHRYAQQGDHTDPVNFDWNNFIVSVNQVDMKRDIAMAAKASSLNVGVSAKTDGNATVNNVDNESVTAPNTAYLQLHTQIRSQVDDAKSSLNNSNSLPPAVADTGLAKKETQDKYVINDNTPHLRGPIDLDPASIKFDKNSGDDLNKMFDENSDDNI